MYINRLYTHLHKLMPGVTSSYIAFLCLILTGCDLPKVLDEFSSNDLGAQEITLSDIVVTPEITELARDRVQVSEIIINAPPKGTVVWRGSITVNQYTKRTQEIVSQQNYTPEYVLVQDTKIAIRNALDHLFEVTPDADAKVTVNLTLAFANTKLNEEKCKNFKTTVRMNLKVLYSWPDGMKIRKAYEGKGETEKCVVFSTIPTAKTAEDTMYIAFEDLFDHLVKSRQE